MFVDIPKNRPVCFFITRWVCVRLFPIVASCPAVLNLTFAKKCQTSRQFCPPLVCSALIKPPSHGVGMVTKTACAFLCLRLKCTDTALIILVKGIVRLRHLHEVWLENENEKSLRLIQPTRQLCLWKGGLTVTFCLWDYYCSECRLLCGCSSAVPLFYCPFFSKKIHWLEANDATLKKRIKIIFFIWCEEHFHFLIVSVVRSRANQQVLPPASCKPYRVIFKIKNNVKKLLVDIVSHFAADHAMLLWLNEQAYTVCH